MAAADGVLVGKEKAAIELSAIELSAQRAARCMQLLQDMIRTCKVKLNAIWMFPSSYLDKVDT